MDHVGSDNQDYHMYLHYCYIRRNFEIVIHPQSV